MKEPLQKFLIVFTYYEGKSLRTKQRLVDAKNINAAVERIKGEYRRFDNLTIQMWEKVERKK